MMKKFVAVLLCLLMILSLFSCNIEKTNDKENREDNTNIIAITSQGDTDTSSTAITSQGDTDTPPTDKTQSEIAIEMYEAVLTNEIKVYETDIEEYNYLADCRTPYESILLRDCENLRYAYTDIDGDSTEELLIDCGDTLILRYYEGTVYLYSFTFRQLSHLNVDGSYYWKYTGQNFECGWSQIYFEGAEMKTKELYRIVNEGEPDAEYYIEDKQVTREEFLKNINDGPEFWLKFEQLEVSWQKKITSEEALQIASEYWGIEDGFTDYGAGSMWIHRIMILDSPSSAWGYYHIGLQIDHYGRDHNDLRVLIKSRMQHLFVGSVTGECQDYVPIYSEK